MDELNRTDIQRIVLLPDDSNECGDLYWKVLDGNVPEMIGNGMVISKGTTIDFSTLINSFSYAKWMKYTEFTKLGLRIAFQGRILVEFYQVENSGTAAKKTIYHGEISDGCPIYPPVGSAAILCCFQITALEDTYIAGASYVTDHVPESVLNKEINIALDICTFHREKWLDRTLTRIKSDVLDNEWDQAGRHLLIFITDNGQTYKLPIENDKRFRLIYQEELGSAGGFSAGAREIMRCKEIEHITHLVFMDDDVIIPSSTIDRTYRLLKWLKDEYAEFLVGGALMRSTEPTVQHENGALWNNGVPRGIKSGLDMAKLGSVVQNEIEERTEYFGWWYCCVPLICIEKRGYPESLYYHRDDVEFGLRNPGQVTLNGIFVWHPPLDVKPKSIDRYYDIRNLAIVNSIHKPGYTKFDLLNRVWFVVSKDILKFRYRDAMLTIRGVEDFCKGKRWIVKNDSGQYYDELKACGYQYVSVAEDTMSGAYDMREADEHVGHCRFFKALLLNGIMLPSHRKIIVPAYEPHFDLFWRASTAINYCRLDETWFVTQKSVTSTFRAIYALIKGSAKVLAKFDFARDSWKKEDKRYGC